MCLPLFLDPRAQEHWFTVRQLHGQWWDLNRSGGQPRQAVARLGCLSDALHVLHPALAAQRRSVRSRRAAMYESTGNWARPPAAPPCCSLFPAPKPLSAFYLSAYLDSLRDQGYTVGARWLARSFCCSWTSAGCWALFGSVSKC